MSTRTPFAYLPHVCTTGERPCVSVDCGFRQYKFYVDDIVELGRELDAAVRFRHMPDEAANACMAEWCRVIGSYLDDDFGAPPEPPGCGAGVVGGEGPQSAPRISQPGCDGRAIPPPWWWRAAIAACVAFGIATTAGWVWALWLGLQIARSWL